MVESRETEGRINEARNVYRDVAARGAQLFFLLNSLGKMHAFYQFSLNSFVVSRVLQYMAWGRELHKSVNPHDSCSVQSPALCYSRSSMCACSPKGAWSPPWPVQDVFERGIDTTPGGRRRPAPDAAARRRTSLHDLVQRRQTQQAGRYEDVMDAARRSTSHGLPRASHAGGSRLTALGDHAGTAGSNRESVIGDATLASAMSRVSHAGGPRMSVLGGGHGSRHSGGPGHLGRLEEPPVEELTPEQLEARLAALLETCTFTVFAHTQRGMFDRDKLVFTTLLTTQTLLKACGLGRFGNQGRLGRAKVQLCLPTPLLVWIAGHHRLTPAPPFLLQNGTIDAREMEHLVRGCSSVWHTYSRDIPACPLRHCPAGLAILKI